MRQKLFLWCLQKREATQKPQVGYSKGLPKVCHTGPYVPAPQQQKCSAQTDNQYVSYSILTSLTNIESLRWGLFLMKQSSEWTLKVSQHGSHNKNLSTIDLSVKDILAGESEGESLKEAHSFSPWPSLTLTFWKLCKEKVAAPTTPQNSRTKQLPAPAILFL